MKNKVRPIDANALAKRIREYMDNFPYAGTRLATCRVVLSMLGDEGQTPTLTDHFPDLTNMIPLTLEQLREMDGEPVWIVESPDWGHWELSEDAEDYILDRDTDLYGLTYHDPDGKAGLHKLGWLAYAYPPTNIDREASIGKRGKSLVAQLAATDITDLLARAEAAEARAEKAETERDAAVADLRLVSDCRTCGNVTPWCIDNPDKCKGWEWRGRKEE